MKIRMVKDKQSSGFYSIFEGFYLIDILFDQFD